MQAMKVRDLMVPIAEYATVSEDAKLYDAVIALEEAQQRVAAERERHWSILVLDTANRVVGKISQWAVLWAIEPRYKHLGDIRETSRYGFSPEFIRSMLDHYALWRKPLEDLCRRAAEMSVKEIMRSPSEAEFIREDATLDEAVHQIVMGRHRSTLVTRGESIVGVLRSSDVFKEVCERIKACRA
jgi:CBS domain-containing protein